MSLFPPPGILSGMREKLSKLRSIENLRRSIEIGRLKAIELRQTGVQTQTEMTFVHLCVRLWGSKEKKTKQRGMEDYNKKKGRKIRIEES